MIYTNIKAIESLLLEGIATPYIKYTNDINRPCEIGYCTVDDKGDVNVKCIVDTKLRSIHFAFSSRDILIEDTNMEMMKDGHIRIWTDNLRYYIVWSINDGVYILDSVSRE